MQAERTIRLDHDIYPLSFLQIYRTANPFIDALEEQDATVQEWFGRSPVLKRVITASGVPLYYHLMTSAYGSIIGSEIAGWIFLRGWRQVLYVEGLAVSPRFRRQGIGKDLMQFAEAQARELHRDWLGLTVTVANSPAVALYERMGYQRGHDRILCMTSRASLPRDGASMRALLAPEANTVFHAYAEHDLRDGDPDTAEVQSRFLGRDAYHSALGKHWLVSINRKPLAYLNRHTRQGNTLLYIAAYREAWATPELIAAMGHVLADVPASTRIDVRVASAGHHEVMCETLAPYGFTEAPAITMKMFKLLT